MPEAPHAGVSKIRSTRAILSQMAMVWYVIRKEPSSFLMHQLQQFNDEHSGSSKSLTNVTSLLCCYTSRLFKCMHTKPSVYQSQESKMTRERSVIYTFLSSLASFLCSFTGVAGYLVCCLLVLFVTKGRLSMDLRGGVVWVIAQQDGSHPGHVRRSLPRNIVKP